MPSAFFMILASYAMSAAQAEVTLRGFGARGIAVPEASPLDALVARVGDRIGRNPHIRRRVSVDAMEALRRRRYRGQYAKQFKKNCEAKVQEVGNDASSQCEDRITAELNNCQASCEDTVRSEVDSAVNQATNEASASCEDRLNTELNNVQAQCESETNRALDEASAQCNQQIEQMQASMPSPGAGGIPPSGGLPPQGIPPSPCVQSNSQTCDDRVADEAVQYQEQIRILEQDLNDERAFKDCLECPVCDFEPMVSASLEVEDEDDGKIDIFGNKVDKVVAIGAGVGGLVGLILIIVILKSACGGSKPAPKKRSAKAKGRGKKKSSKAKGGRAGNSYKNMH